VTDFDAVGIFAVRFAPAKPPHEALHMGLAGCVAVDPFGFKFETFFGSHCELGHAQANANVTQNHLGAESCSESTKLDSRTATAEQVGQVQGLVAGLASGVENQAVGFVSVTNVLVANQPVAIVVVGSGFALLATCSEQSLFVLGDQTNQFAGGVFVCANMNMDATRFVATSTHVTQPLENKLDLTDAVSTHKDRGDDFDATLAVRRTNRRIGLSVPALGQAIDLKPVVIPADANPGVLKVLLGDVALDFDAEGQVGSVGGVHRSASFVFRSRH